jgi:metal-responsive CopG/Arc/MetJ family transcriptional regulator
MNSDNKIILGILVTKATKNIEALQDLFTTYGCCIKTRLGLHSPVNDENITGLIILELMGDMEQIVSFQNELSMFEGIKINKMEF